jgi:tRNA A-37 threonylcarbamoyl transferase component Bud32
VSPNALEAALKTLEQHGQLIKDRPQRQIWRFQVEGAGYYLKFYPRQGTFFKRLFRGNPALREFARLQWLQKAQVPAPRPQSVLLGMHLKGQLGDALVMRAIEPAVQLDHYLNNLQLTGLHAPEHRRVSEQIRTILSQLARAGLGHSDLHLGNFLLSDDQVYLLDAYAVHKRGLRLKDLLHLAHSAGTHATIGDLRRAWESVGPPGPMPKTNPVSRSLWRKQLSRITSNNRYFGSIRSGDWSGWHFKQAKFPRPWSSSSGLTFTTDQWQSAWSTLVKKIESDQLDILKRSASGDVLAGEIVVGARPMRVVIKRPRKKHLRRYLDFRGSRARRAWVKAWNLVVRDIPTAWPLLIMEKRQFGYVTESLLVCERVEGLQLGATNLDAMNESDRFTLMFRCGRLLRRLDNAGLYHRDAKASNFLITRDPLNHPTPVLVDVDGIQPMRWNRWSAQRLLTSMKGHRQYTPLDSLALCKGYAPYARIEREIGPNTSANPPE